MAISFNLTTAAAKTQLENLDKALLVTKEGFSNLGAVIERISSSSAAKALQSLAQVSDTLANSQTKLAATTKSATNAAEKGTSLTPKLKRLKLELKDGTSSLTKSVRDATAAYTVEAAQIQETTLKLQRRKDIILKALPAERESNANTKAKLVLDQQNISVIAQANAIRIREVELSAKASGLKAAEVATKVREFEVNNLLSTSNKKSIVEAIRIIELESRRQKLQRLKITSSDLEIQALNKKIIVETVLASQTRKLTELEALQNSETTKRIITLEVENSLQQQLISTEARLNSATLQKLIARKLDLRLAEEKALADAKAARGLDKETNSLKKNTSAKVQSTTEQKALNTAYSDGNRRSAEFRAGLNALGLGFGIFTGSTVFLAAGVFSVVKALKSAITEYAQFDFAMDRAGAVMESNAIQTVQLRSAVRELARTTVFTAKEVSEGLIFLGQAGQSTSEALQSLEPTLRLAEIGLIDMQQAADLVTNVMAAFNIQADQLANVVDLLSVVVTSSNTDITQLAQAISFVGPAAQATNTSLRETAVILGFFANAGVKSSRAGTALRRGIANLAAPTEKVSKVLFNLGINVIDPLTGQMESMTKLILDLKKEGASLSDVFTLFGTRAGPTFAAAIIGDSTSLEELLKKTEDVTGATDRLIKRLEDNQVSDALKAVSAGAEALITLGRALADIVTPALAALTIMFNGLAAVLKHTSLLFKSIIATLAVLATLKILSFLGGLITSLKVLQFVTVTASGSFSLLTAEMTAAGATANFVANSLVKVGAASRAMFGAVGFIITGVLAAAFLSMESAAEKAKREITATVGQVARLADVMAALKSTAGSKDALEGISTEINNVLDSLKNIKNTSGDSLGTIFTQEIETARERLKGFKGELITLAAKGILGNGLLPDTKAQTAEYKQQAEALSGRIDRQQQIIALAKEGLAISKRQGLADKTILESKRISAEISREKAKSLKDATLKKAGEEAAARLADKVFNVGKKISNILEGDVDNEGAKLRITLKQLDAERKIMQLKLASGNLNQAQETALSKLLGENLSKRKAAVEAFGTQVKQLGSDLFINLFSKLVQGKLNEGEFAKQLKFISAKLLGGNSDFLTVLQERLDLYKATLLSQTKAQFDAEEALNKAGLARLVDYQTSKLKILTAGNVILSAEAKVALTRDTQNIKSAYTARLISLQEFIDKNIAAEQLSSQTTIGGLLAVGDALRQNRLELLQRKTDLGASGEVLKTLSAALNTNTKNQEANTASLKKARLAQESTKLALENYVNIVANDALLAANKFLARQEAQLSVLNGLSGGYLSTAESLLAYTISQLRASKAAKEGNKAILAQIATLQKLQDKMHGNSVAIKGLQNDWQDASHNMAGEALRASETMANAFTDFLINPTKKGFEDLGKSFLKLIAQILAKRAILSLFNKQADGSKGLAGFFDAIFGGAAGTSGTGTTTPASPNKSASGGVFRVGGSGGIDSEVFSSRVTPGEIVTISNPNGGVDRQLSNLQGNVITFNNTVNLTSGSNNTEDVQQIVEDGMRVLEAKIIRQQQRQQKALGVR